MEFLRQKTPMLGEGLAKMAMVAILEQIKKQRGLTSFIEHQGVNGKWLLPEEPYDIRFAKLVKILKIKAHYQTEDEWWNDWAELGEMIMSHSSRGVTNP